MSNEKEIDKDIEEKARVSETPDEDPRDKQ